MSALSALMGMCGCAAREDTGLYQRLQDEDPMVRQEALVDATNQPGTKVLPYMVAALSDQDPVVRMTAILGLERKTGTSLGYRYYEPWEQRQEAIQRWHQYLQDRGQRPREVPAPPTEGPSSVPEQPAEPDEDPQQR